MLYLLLELIFAPVAPKPWAVFGSKSQHCSRSKGPTTNFASNIQNWLISGFHGYRLSDAQLKILEFNSQARVVGLIASLTCHMSQAMSYTQGPPTEPWPRASTTQKMALHLAVKDFNRGLSSYIVIFLGCCNQMKRQLPN